jgi:hypothetical protein
MYAFQTKHAFGPWRVYFDYMLKTKQTHMHVRIPKKTLPRALRLEKTLLGTLQYDSLYERKKQNGNRNTEFLQMPLACGWIAGITEAPAPVKNAMLHGENTSSA